jgi:excisionase family DNA binding protein
MITVKEAARRAERHPVHIYRLAAAGTLRTRKHGRRRLIDPKSLQAYIDTRNGAWEALCRAQAALRARVAAEMLQGQGEAATAARMAPDMSWHRTWGHE